MIKAISYDSKERLLEIVFNNGRIYQYTGVPPEVYQALLNAESKGYYFQEHIRNVYPYWQVRKKW